MRMILGIYAVLLISGGHLPDRPIPTSRAAEVMTVPAGFKVQLAAGEPTVVQPIAFTFDDKGRLWVVECLSYPKWSKDGKGQDRVVILEDPDDKGTYRKRTVVIDNGVNLSGLELGFGGLYLCSTPNLIFIPLQNDQPSGPPQVLLDGWNLNDAKHNVFNSLIWGPDGWLYGCNGIQTRSWVGKPGTPQNQRTYIDCGVWRYHPTRQLFEVVATGTTNPWGLDWDDRGEMFITNCVIDHLWHVVPGGRYRRMYGQDSNPYSYGFMGPSSDHKHWAGGHWTESRADRATGSLKKEHDDAGGGHAHSGCAIYLADQFPSEYRNSVFMANIHGSRLNRDRLSYEQNSTIVGKRAPDFLFANDSWFRGIAVKVGPEGSLYVSDWTDTGECHNYDIADTSNGRIYRVTYGDFKPFQGDVGQSSEAKLIAAQLSGNEWLVRKARRVLHERATQGKLSADVADKLRQLRQNKLSGTQQLRVVWALRVIGELKWADLEGLIQQPETATWAMRLAGELEPKATMLLGLLQRTPESEKFRVRAALASVMPKLPAAEVFQIASVLGQDAAILADSNLVQLLWLGVQKAALEQPEQGLKLATKVRLAPVQRNLVRQYCARPNSDSALSRDAVLALLEANLGANTIQPIVEGLLQSLEGQRQVGLPPKWQSVYPQLMQHETRTIRDTAQALALVFGDQRAVTELTATLRDSKAEAAARIQAIQRLSAQKSAELPKVLHELLPDEAIRAAAIRALAVFADPETPAAILKVYPKLREGEKADALQTLASRPAYALALLTAVEQSQLPRADIGVFTARQIQSLNDRTVSARLEKVWGTVRPASANRMAQTRQWKEKLGGETLKQANLSNGRQVYTQNCASCHKLFGEGGDVGPELTGSQRKSLDYLLENVLDPSAIVAGEYRMVVFNLLDGRTLTGIVRKETPQAITIRTLNEEVVVPVADIDTRKPTQLSIMPDGLFDKLTPEQVRDLVGYLASSEQVPLPRK